MQCPKCGGSVSPAAPGAYRGSDGKLWHMACGRAAGVRGV